ncbi:hypothetical protein PP940_gp203 [Rhizobium phage RL2RES]|uniref:Uncharacterized protein n=1 Tax=Rhizobium phage RL2RES TaxID=103371 RepID=A0A6B9J1G4_9CAUD|nr:hypothetical protein PP940_gp203 [Rhizobium phage RL2RES]QGZ14199.1 hypothetical protein RL2RES_203 [Rhizobium phage RL2RES]
MKEYKQNSVNEAELVHHLNRNASHRWEPIHFEKIANSASYRVIFSREKKFDEPQESKMTLRFKYAFEAITNDVEEQNSLIFRGEMLLKLVDLIKEATPEQIEALGPRYKWIEKGKLADLYAIDLIEAAAHLGYRVIPALEKIEILE